MMVGIILSSLAKIVVSIGHFHNLYFIICIQSSRLDKICIDLPLYLCDFAFVLVLGVNIESIRGLWLATAGVNSPSGPHHHYLVHRSLTNKFMKTETSIMASRKDRNIQDFILCPVQKQDLCKVIKLVISHSHMSIHIIRIILKACQIMCTGNDHFIKKSGQDDMGRFQNIYHFSGQNIKQYR